MTLLPRRASRAWSPEVRARRRRERFLAEIRADIEYRILRFMKQWDDAVEPWLDEPGNRFRSTLYRHK